MCVCVCTCLETGDLDFAKRLNTEVNGSRRTRKVVERLGVVSVTKEFGLLPRVPYKESCKEKLIAEHSLYFGAEGEFGAYGKKVAKKLKKVKRDEWQSDSSAEGSKEHKRHCSAALADRAAKIAQKEDRRASGSSSSDSSDDSSDGGVCEPCEVHYMTKTEHVEQLMKHQRKMDSIMRYARKNPISRK